MCYGERFVRTFCTSKKHGMFPNKNPYELDKYDIRDNLIELINDDTKIRNDTETGKVDSDFFASEELYLQAFSEISSLLKAFRDKE